METVADHLETCANNIPMECWEIILVKAYTRYFQRHYCEEKTVLCNLASVCFFWLVTMARHRFKCYLHRCMSAFFSQIGCRGIIVRNNRGFLKENIRPTSNLMKYLTSAECLTREKAKLIRGLSFDQDKNHELYMMIKPYDNIWILSFIDCLQQNDQHMVAQVIEKGGGTVKVRFPEKSMSVLSFTEKEQLVHSLNQIWEKTQPRNERLEILICKLKKSDIQILRAVRKRGIAIWFWCQTQIGLQRMQSSDFVLDLVRSLFSCCCLSYQKLILEFTLKDFCISSEQFNKEFVTCPIGIHFETRLHIETRKSATVVGVTELYNFIYVLVAIENFYTIRVFNNLQAIQDIPADDNMTEPKGIVACHKAGCLYVLDGGGLYEKKQDWCFWRITLPDHQFTEWRDKSYNLQFSDKHVELISYSVSSSGHLLLLKYDCNERPIECQLDAYQTDSSSLQPQQCYDPITFHIKDPHHAVETLEGNFIISFGYLNESGVKELTVDGVVVRHFHYFDPKDLSQPLSEPVYLTLASYDQVLVASKRNNSVILLDSQLSFYEILLTSSTYGIECPTQLCYCSIKKQLLVLHSKKKKIDVYVLSNTTL